MIDIKLLLEDIGIDYKSDGKNVGSNDVNIDCPFCGADFHLGINIESGQVNCWVCGFDGESRRPSLGKVIMRAAELSWPEAKAAMEEHGWEQNDPFKEGQSDGLADKCVLPIGSYRLYGSEKQTREAARALEYMKNRGFSEQTAKDYNLHITEGLYYSRRIIIPIHFEGKLVCYTSRSYISGDNRYKNAPLFKSAMRVKDLLYNYDRVKGKKDAFLLEGCTDVWVMGDDSLGVFKSSLSPKQRNLIIKLNLDSLTIIYDPLATERAYSAAEELSPFIHSIKVVRLDGTKDVGTRTRAEVIRIKNETREFKG